MGQPAWWFVIGVGGWAGCNPSLADYCAPASPECTPADGGVTDATTNVGQERDAQRDEMAAPDVSTCDPTKSPHDDPCVVADSHGVFVSPAGSDANLGTRSSPLSTIGRGMDLGKAAGKRVYVCAGSFDERLRVGATRDGVSVYGGLDCTTWAYGAGNRVVVAPAAAGYALELDGLLAGATFEDIEFDSQNASPARAGESSIAVFANDSRNVALQRVTMVAGHGADGSSGTSGGPGPDGGTSAAPSNWLGTPPSYGELNGMNAADAGGAPSTTCTCPDQSTSSGGQGGAPSGQTPSTGMPSYDVAGAGAGGVNGAVCGNGGSPIANGADAPDAAANPASTALGACAASGWTPAVGVNGADGKPGQGGGGGGNGRLSSGSGGGGACGGCGGAGGKAGSGGGSSIALLSYQSSVALAGCVLTAKAAGNGGAGGSGEPGQAGGSPGSPSGVGAGVGCTGGTGGAGAGGNGAQGGPGGLSLGIGYCGLPPTIDGVVVTQAASRAGITLGSAGLAGVGGSKGAEAMSSTGPAGADGASGPDGIAAAIGSLP